MNYKIEKSFRSIDYPCIVIMGDMGHRCGYVGIPTDHALYGVDYDEQHYKLYPYYDMVASKRQVSHNCLIDNIGAIPLFLIMYGGKDLRTPSICLGVHGGLTYSASSDRKYPISIRDYWWFGYDCGHSGDAKDFTVTSSYMKELEEKYPTGGVLRTTEYCVYECAKLADQLRMVDKVYKERKEILFRNFRGVDG